MLAKSENREGVSENAPTTQLPETVQDSCPCKKDNKTYTLRVAGVQKGRGF